MKNTVLVLLFLSINCTYSQQQYVNLFNKDLTERIRFESYPKQTVNKDLDMAVKIHPELLYYYITYHNVKYDGKVDPGLRLYDKELGEARSKYIRERNSWFRLGEEHLRIMEKDSNQLAGELQYLNNNNFYGNIIIGKICDSCYKTDKNRRDYFVYKFYIKDSDMIYLPNEDYASLRKEYEAEVKSTIEEYLEELSNKSIYLGSAEDSYKKLISFWYLFPDAKQKEPIQAQFTKLIFNSFYEDYLAANSKNINNGNTEILGQADYIRKTGIVKIILGYNNNLIKSFNYKYKPSFGTDAEIKNQFNISTNQVYAGLSLAIRLSEKESMFSRLVFEGCCGINLAEKTLFPTYPAEPPAPTGLQHEEFILSYMMTPDKNNLKIKRMLNFTFKAKTPIFFIGQNLNLGIGGVADYYVLNYLTNLDFYFLKFTRFINSRGQVTSYTRDYHKQILNGNEETQNLVKFYPLLTAEYKISRDFNLNCEASLNYYVFSVSYNLLTQ